MSPSRAIPNDVVRVELASVDGCPYVESARLRLREAFDYLGINPHVVEYPLGPAAPAWLVGYPSPTIFVDGVAVGATGELDARTYRGVPLRPVTPFGALVQALQLALSQT